MKITLNLPLGKNEVLTKELPFLIAKAITPQAQVNDERIVAIEKLVYASLSDNEDTKSEHSAGYLSESELASFGKACRIAGLPTLLSIIEKKETNISEWKLYENAIKNHFPKLQYKLKPRSNTTLEIMAEQHREYLEEAVENGEVIIHDCMAHFPLKHAKGLTTLEHAYMTLNTFTQYVAKFNLCVIVGDNQTSASQSQHTSTSKLPPAPYSERLNAINELAVKTAWEIEHKNFGVITKPKVLMDELKKMAVNKSNKILLGEIAHGVKWFSSGYQELNYDIGACRQTLSRWYKKRGISLKT